MTVYIRYNRSISSPFSHTQALDWLQETGEQYLATHTSPGETTEKTQGLLKDYEEFRVSAKVC